MAYAVRTGNNTNSSPPEQSQVMGSTPLLQGSALSAPVDIALPNSFISKDNESQESSGDEFYSPPSTPEYSPDTPSGFLAQAAGVRDLHFDTVSRDTFFTPCANTPERIRKMVSFSYRVAKCDLTRIKICELLGFVEIIQAIKTENASLLRISMLVQIFFEILLQLCSRDSIQIFLKMAWFLTLGTKPI